MAGSKRRFSLLAILLPLLFLTMSGLARAAIITVANTNDSGAGSLRAAITAHASGDTIEFSVSGTITLLSELPAIADTLTIDGSGQTVTVSGNSAFQIISTDLTGALTLKFLTFEDGSPALSGGAFANLGTATIANDLFTDNHSTLNGGAIANMGTLTVINSTFSGNEAAGEGGAIYTSDAAVSFITNVTFSGNTASPSGNGPAKLSTCGSASPCYSSSTSGTANSNPCVPATIAGITSGQLIFGCSTNYSCPSGFTTLDRGTDVPSVVTCYKVAGSSETGSYSFPTIGGFGQCSIEVVSNTTGTLDTGSGTGHATTQTTGSSITLPSLTTSVGNDVYFACLGFMEPSATMPSSTGFTSRQFNQAVPHVNYAQGLTDLLAQTAGTYSGYTAGQGSSGDLTANVAIFKAAVTPPPTATPGGALFNAGGTVDLKGSILATSTGGNCAGTDAITDVGHNISDDGTCPTSSGTSVENSTTLNLDPAGLKDNGGPTDTIALEPTSEAVEFIPVADCTDQSSPTPIALTDDQRGDPRPDPGNPNFCSAGAFELQTSEDFTLKSERIQIARSSGMNEDEVNMALTFSTVPNPSCDTADDVLDNGLTVELFAGTCGATTGSGLSTDLDPFAVHTINTQKYGTFFGSTPPETISARMVAMPAPAGTCGEWTLNLEVAGLDTPALGLGGNNPFALELMDSDLHSFGCFNINNAIVGTQIDPPAKTVRRGVRR